MPSPHHSVAARSLPSSSRLRSCRGSWAASPSSKCLLQAPETEVYEVHISQPDRSPSLPAGPFRTKNTTTIAKISVDVSDILYFFCSGEGRGSATRQEGGGVRFLLKMPGGRGSLGRGGGGGPGGPGGCLRGIWGGGGPKYFFRGRNSHQEIVNYYQQCAY